MTAVASVLLVPSEGDPHKLLGDPESVAWKLGARPALAWHTAHGAPYHPWAAGPAPGRWRTESKPREALVLMWEKEVLGDVCDAIALRIGRVSWTLMRLMVAAAQELECVLVVLDAHGIAIESGEAQLPTTMEPFTVTLSRSTVEKEPIDAMIRDLWPPGLKP